MMSLYILFFITACLYSSVGFGGGSTYLALLTLFSFPYEAVPKMGLICNLVVVTNSLYYYLKFKLLPFKQTIPLVLTSVPMSFLGGKTHISKTVFLWLLSISLLIAGLRLMISRKPENNPSRHLTTISNKIFPLWLKLAVGALLGFLSGIVGIGGGIFLAPLLYLLNWGTSKQIAATTSFFIFINSISGLLGQITKIELKLDVHIILGLAISVFLGGQIGSRLCIGKLSLSHIQKITALLTLYASWNIIYKLL